MTLTYALIANGGIILAADSQTTYRHEVANFGQPSLVAAYEGKRSKIRTLRNGSAFSIAGNTGLVDWVLAKADSERIDDTKPLDHMVFEYSRLFRAEYLKAYQDTDWRPRCAFLFCGYSGVNGNRAPQIIKLSSENTFMFNPLEGFGFTGDVEHGALLYLHHRLYSPGLPLDTAKCLAYCILAEVADLDNSVGGPIEMAIVTESGVKPFTEFDRYERKRQQIHETVRSMIHSARES
jgi:20S proteasome alpha/beta subunit